MARTNLTEITPDNEEMESLFIDFALLPTGKIFVITNKDPRIPEYRDAKHLTMFTPQQATELITFLQKSLDEYTNKTIN